MKTSVVTFCLFLFVFLLTAETPTPASAETTFTETARMSDITPFSQSIVYELKSGDSEGGAHIIYYPVTIADNNTSRKAHSFASNLPLISSQLPLAPKLHVSFEHSQGANQAFYVAVKKNDNTYQVLQTPDIASDSVSTELTIRLYDLCLNGTCNLDTYGTGDINDNQLIYVVAAEKNALGVGQTLDPSAEAFKEGVYLNVKFSSLFDSSGVPVLASIGRGDGQLLLHYTNGTINSNISSFLYQVLVVNYGSDSRGQLPYQTALALSPAPTITRYDIPPGLGITLKGLTNGTTYNLALALMNKFLFVTPVTASQSSTPVELEVFLQEQGCFLISAGFQTDHYVLDFFRHFRDQTLLKFSWGAKFVHWYYQWAPVYAPVIYKSPLLSALIRGFSFVLYFAMNFFIYLALLGLLILGGGVIVRSRKKTT